MPLGELAFHTLEESLGLPLRGNWPRNHESALSHSGAFGHQRMPYRQQKDLHHSAAILLLQFRIEVHDQSSIFITFLDQSLDHLVVFFGIVRQLAAIMAY